MSIDESAQTEYQIKTFTESIDKTQSEFEDIIIGHHYKFLWTYAINCILAICLLLQPFIFHYKSHALIGSDIISGLLVITIELLSFSKRRAIWRWGITIISFWLLLAPLIFWAPQPAIYLMDTLIACLLITFSVLVPGIPGRGGIDIPGPDKPPAWTYNPSSWIRRWLGIALALIGFLISRYLAAHQLGYIDHAWDPFFGNGSDKITGSALSRSFPISDAGLGAVAYILEVLTGFMGDKARWRTAPFIAVMFAVLVLPLGITSIVLVIMQPVVVGAWCGLCLISAAALLMSVPLAVHEAIAVGQFLIQANSQKKNLWQIFWLGGTVTNAGSIDPDRTNYSLSQRWIASVQGVTVPLTIVIQIAIGIWLMARPDILPYAGKTANIDHLLGAIIVTIAALASAEVTRAARLINIVIGIVLVFAAIIFAHSLPLVFISEFVSGILLIFASLPKGGIVECYATWDKYIK